MVNFETEVYSQQEEDIVGVKVIVDAEGQTIDSISCVDATELQELEAKLDNLDEKYVGFATGSSLAGSDLDTILENSNENAEINATSLNGFQSDYFSKSNHQHNKAGITDLYNYDISLSKYNVNLTDDTVDKTVTVTVKVTNSTNSPVNKETISIYKNGELWKSNVKTGSNGVYTTTFTPDTNGIVTFSVNNQKVQLNVEQGWRTLYNGTFGKIKTNGELVSCYFKSASQNIPSDAWKNVARLSAISLDEKYYPPHDIYSRENAGVDVRIRDNGILEAVSRTGARTAAVGIYAVYLLKELQNR